MPGIGAVLAALAVLALLAGLVSYRARRRLDEPQTTAILSVIVGADLLVFAISASMV